MNKKSKYLKNNPNTRGIRSDYWTEEKVNESIKDIQETNWIENKPTYNNTYLIVANGKQYKLEYEEMVEFCTAFRTCALGNEAFISAKLKAEIITENLPSTSY